MVGSGTLTSYTTLYNTGASTTAVIAAIYVANTGTTNRLYRIGIMGSAGTPAAASGEFLAYDVTVAANDTVEIEPLSLGVTQYIRCSSDSAEVNFMAFIAEISA